MGGLGVKPHEGLIHNDEPGVVEPRGDDGQLLLHAVGVGGDGLRQIAGQLEGVRIGADALPPGLGVHAEHVGDEVQVLDARHVIVQVGVVGDIGQQALAGQRVGLDGLAADGDLALIELQDAHHGFQGGGLACAVVSDKAVDLAGGDVQRQVVHGLLLAVGLGQMLNVQHGVPPYFLSAISITMPRWGVIQPRLRLMMRTMPITAAYSTPATAQMIQLYWGWPLPLGP